MLFILQAICRITINYLILINSIEI